MILRLLSSLITVRVPPKYLSVGRIEVLGDREEFLLDKPRTSEAEHGVRRTSLIIRAAGSTSAETLLADERSGSLTVYRKVSNLIT